MFMWSCERVCNKYLCRSSSQHKLGQSAPRLHSKPAFQWQCSTVVDLRQIQVMLAMAGSLLTNLILWAAICSCRRTSWGCAVQSILRLPKALRANFLQALGAHTRVGMLLVDVASWSGMLIAKCKIGTRCRDELSRERVERHDKGHLQAGHGATT